jgi:hypothetical protein
MPDAAEPYKPIQILRAGPLAISLPACLPLWRDLEAILASRRVRKWGTTGRGHATPETTRLTQSGRRAAANCAPQLRAIFAGFDKPSHWNH